MDGTQSNSFNGEEQFDLVQKMRMENYERFKALVRMHLSFELDMNTDEFDIPYNEIVYYEKGKLKKWDSITKKIKACTSSKINSPAAEDHSLQLNLDLIQQLRKLKDFLALDHNMKQEGIFRLTGSVSRQNELRGLINSRKPFDLNKSYTVHDCATVFKNFLSNLSEPLLTDAHYPAHCQIAELCNNVDKDTSRNKGTHILHSVQLLLLLLPEMNRILFQDIIEILHKAVMYKEFNKMSADNLATLFCPHLICPRNIPPEALYYISQKMYKIISYMITKGPLIFETPPKLVTDIRAYFLEQKRKQTLSPEQTLDESISDVSTVNTVYTFVDREKTAAANNSDATDTALAQLYAHIQSLPESSKKRKLIRQFNKENGQGTPLQLLLMNRIKSDASSATRSAKSISDSIKKHIFHKSLICRTPKRSNFGTPNASTKSTKSRVLFQSPICNSTLNISSSIKKHNLHKSISSSSLLTTNPPKLEIDESLNDHQTTAFNNKASDESLNLLTILTTKENRNDSVLKIPTGEASMSPTSIQHSYSENDHVTWKNDSNSESLLNNENLSIKILQQCPELKSKYKSEPNLSQIQYEDSCFNDSSDGSTLFMNIKLTKPSSMMNMSEYQTRNHKKTENLLKKESDSMNILCSPLITTDNVSTNICKNKNLITSTPSIFLGRRSMSPITKSTQRMPKSMQESIMTPRSRKPVMLTTTLESTERNQTTCQSDLSSFREEDEDSLLMNELNKNITENQTIMANNDSLKDTSFIPDALTSTFREYLLSRKVLTTSPEDSSFSSHSDDFCSTPDVHNFTETNLSESLLYCLNGNNPITNITDNSSSSLLDESYRNCDVNKTDQIMITSRKRSILQNDNDKENCHEENIIQGKKLLVMKETLDETSI